MLLAALENIDPYRESVKLQLSLYPACCGANQTAILNLDVCTEYYKQLKLRDFNYAPITNTTDSEHLVFDCHFYGLTPLNSPGDKVVAE